MIATVTNSGISKVRYGGLDGLRAIAIILVLLYHLTPGRNSDNGLQSLVFKIADIGYIGVDLFFVLSGFLITSILLRYKREGRPLRLYFYRRLLRIVPLYYSVIIFVFILIPVFTDLPGYPLFSEQLPFWLYIQNYFTGIVEDNIYFHLGHFWTLAVEMQFYLVWPFVLKIVPLNTILKLCVIFLFLVLLVKIWLVLEGYSWQVTYKWTPLRLEGLLTGSLIAVCREQGCDFNLANKLQNTIIALLGILIASVAWFHLADAVLKPAESATFLFIRVMLPLIVSIFFGMLVIQALKDCTFSKILSNKVFISIAKYSYGMYVIHYLFLPVLLEYLLPVMKRMFGDTDVAIYGYFILVSSITFILSVISYHVLEKRFLQMKLHQ